MTFQLKAFQAYGIEPQEPIFKRYVQRAILTIAAANTDTALDISNTAGTFWTAVIADGTFGVTVGTPALAAIKDIVTRAESFNNVISQELLTRQSSNYGPQVFTSAASAGGAATEVYTVTGLLATDVVAAVTPTVAGANAVYMRAWNTLAANALSVQYSGDPGAGAKVTVEVLRKADTPLAGTYGLTVTGKLPALTWNSGDAPTAYDLVLEWTLSPAQELVEIYVP